MAQGCTCAGAVNYIGCPIHFLQQYASTSSAQTWSVSHTVQSQFTSSLARLVRPWNLDNVNAYVQASLDQPQLQHALFQLLCSPEWDNQNPEPFSDLDPFIISASRRFHCVFNGCRVSFRRIERARSHIRMHLNWRPFQCQGGHDHAGCGQRFVSEEYLRAHLDRRDILCDRCGSSIRQKNIARHRSSQKCIRHQYAWTHQNSFKKGKN